MQKFKVFLNGYVTYIVDEEDRAIALAEDDLRYIHPKFNIDVSFFCLPAYFCFTLHNLKEVYIYNSIMAIILNLGLNYQI